MTTKRRRTDADYEAAAADYEATPIRRDEIRSIELGPGLLRNGRPPATATATGKTPTMALRLPNDMRAAMKLRVKAEGLSSESELVRLALLEYFDHHPVA